MWRFPRPVPMLLHSSTVNKLSNLDGTKVKQIIMTEGRYPATVPGLASSVNAPGKILHLYIKLKKHPNWGLPRAQYYKTSPFLLPNILFLCVIFVPNFLFLKFFSVWSHCHCKNNLPRQGQYHRDLLFLGLTLLKCPVLPYSGPANFLFSAAPQLPPLQVKSSMLAEVSTDCFLTMFKSVFDLCFLLT